MNLDLADIIGNERESVATHCRQYSKASFSPDKPLMAQLTLSPLKDYSVEIELNPALIAKIKSKLDS